MLTLTLLGGFDVRVDGREPIGMSRKERALLAWIAMHPNHSIGRDVTAFALWGEKPQKLASASLSQALYSLKKVLAEHGCNAVSAESDTIALVADQVNIDALAFSRLARKGDHDSIKAAVDLYKGELLEGFTDSSAEFEEWLETERRYLKAEAVNVLTAYLDSEIDLAANAKFAETARRLSEIDKLNEDACRALMLHHAARDQVSAAAEAYEWLRQRLENELDTEPSEKTRDLYSRILQHEVPCFRKAQPEAAEAGLRRRVANLSRGPIVLAVGLMFLLVFAGWWIQSTSEFTPLDPATMEHRLPDKPSIAVLAFDDLSQVDDRGYLSDAIAENIITKLSLFSELFVIARNSSFYYRNNPADVREIARELGVRYILEGSQQKAGDRLRVTVQLIDAVGGEHLWSRTYDPELVDIFKVQDEISASVAATLGAKLTMIAGEEAKRADPDQLRAYEFVLKGLRYFHQFTWEGTEKAQEAYESALQLDSELVNAHSSLAFVHINGFRWGWTELTRDEALARAHQHADIALHLEPENYQSHFAMAYVLTQTGEHSKAIVEYEKTLELNPNAGDAMANYAEQLGYEGRFREAVDWLEKAIRLDPHHPDWYLWNLGWAQYSEGDCDRALRTLQEMSNFPPFANRTLAATYVCLGRTGEARDAIAALLKFDPDYSVSKFHLNFRGKYRNPDLLEVWTDDLRVAGLPE